MNKGTVHKMTPGLLVTLLIVILIALSFLADWRSIATFGEPADTVIDVVLEQTEVPSNTPTASTSVQSEPVVEAAESTAELLPQSEQITQPPVETPESSPTPTVPSEQATDNIPVQEFSISSSNQTPPEDVLREIAFHPGAGGGDAPCYGEYQQPTIGFSSGNLELRDTVSVTACGWQNNELVTITLNLPDGTSISETKQADGPDFGLSFSYETELTSPPGIYTIVFEGESGTVEHAIEIEMPTEPRLYLEDEGRLLLINFQPNERVRLFVYEDKDGIVNHRLVAWQEFSVDSGGRLIVQLELDMTVHRHYVVLGDVSREVTPFGVYFHLRDILLGYVKPSGQNDIAISDCPDPSCPILQTTYSGLRVTGELRTSDNCVILSECIWWPVLLFDGRSGWVNDYGVVHRGTYSPFGLDGSFDGDTLVKFELILDYMSGLNRAWFIWPTETPVICNEIEQALNEVKIEPYESTRLYDGAFYPDRVDIPFFENYRAVALEGLPTGWAFRVDAAVEECPHLETLLSES